jgi:hypothetical protein
MLLNVGPQSFHKEMLKSEAATKAVEDLRGIGIHVTKLSEVSQSKADHNFSKPRQAETETLRKHLIHDHSVSFSNAIAKPRIKSNSLQTKDNQKYPIASEINENFVTASQVRTV